MAGLDSVLGIHADALQFQRQRMEVLAANIANADTPGYLARDLDFAAALASAQSSANTRPALTDARHLPISTAAEAAARVYRVPTQPSADGNTVELQIEQGKFADAALQYKASLSFADSRIRTLLTAITGQ